LHDLVVLAGSIKHGHQAGALLGPIASPRRLVIIIFIIDGLMALECHGLEYAGQPIWM